MTDHVDLLLDRVRIEQELPAPEVRRALRRAAGVTLDDIAEAAGVTLQAVARWENGTRRPRHDHLRVYSRILTGLSRAGVLEPA